jgi:TetR/AcrR family transcriptional regulator, regulator of cefoperazone and chloramphenicol sensitivity
MTLATRRRGERAAVTRARMLDVAEQLMARHGIEGVSLRQIGAATGQANNSALQYHFGDKSSLVTEIIARRVASFEPRRQALLAQADAEGRLADPRALLAIIFLPIIEAVDAEGRHVYAAFLLQFLTRGQYEADLSHPGGGADSAVLAAIHHLSMLRGDLSMARFGARLACLNGMLLNALVERDNARLHGRATGDDGEAVADVLNMMAVALRAPPPTA